MAHQIISSARNPAVKQLRKLLSSRKYRQQRALTVAEGVNLVTSYLQAGGRPQQVILAQSAAANQEVQRLLERLDSALPRLVLRDGTFESLAQIHATVGVMIVISTALPPKSRSLTTGNQLLLEDIQDPGNLGTILRTAAAAGVDRVYLSEKSASPWSPKALRAGMGAQFSLAIEEAADLVAVAEQAKPPVIATDLAADKELYQLDLTGDQLWAFGNEGQGLSADLRAACTQAVVIPQAAGAVESLNVAATVAVCLFEQARQQAMVQP